MIRFFGLFLFSITILFSGSAYATLKKDAYKIFTRINSIPPNKMDITLMSNFLADNQKEKAIEYALNSKHFYNVRLKNWVKTWSNEDATNLVELNDYVATVIGFIRDDIAFNQILSADIVYVANANIVDIPAYSLENNNHYKELEKKNLDLKASLVMRSQKTLTGMMDNAGVLTSRGAAEAFFIDGTNRAMTRYTFMNFLCKDFEDLHDINIPDFKVRRDVDRSPGGDSRTFKNKCVGCHAGQDGLGGAFAYFDFKDGKFMHTPGTVTEKINKNILYPSGNIVQDDSWINLWANGQNSSLGWRGETSGAGAKSFGQMLGRTKQFSKCMVEKSYKLICLNDIKDKHTAPELEDLITGFEENYSMKNLFKEVGLLCL